MEKYVERNETGKGEEMEKKEGRWMEEGDEKEELEGR